jgi:hypothetical protein
MHDVQRNNNNNNNIDYQIVRPFIATPEHEPVPCTRTGLQGLLEQQSLNAGCPDKLVWHQLLYTPQEPEGIRTFCAAKIF